LIEGRILKGIGGFYYVETTQGLIECKARGKFRKTVGKPIVGDLVMLEIQPDGTGYLTEIQPRKNELIRPAVSNLDLIAIVATEAQPKTEPFLIDKVIAIAENKGIDVCVVLNKTDLDPCDTLYQTYSQAGIDTFRVCAQNGEGIEQLREHLHGKVTAFAGNSGVGKSSLLNRLKPDFFAETGTISDRIGRGRHTTRHVELVPFENGFLADTPGFSSFDTEQMDLVMAVDLQYTFREFEPYLDQCRFTGCAHVKEKGCAVLDAVEQGMIPKTRHESYVSLYNSVKDIKEWQIGKDGRR
jgi:ribosome biogenesis GTPase